MDKKRILLNIFTGVIMKVIILVVTMISKSFVVKILGNEANGLLSLFISIIGFVSIVDIGIGGAITFSLYKPIVDNDTDKISSLYHWYKKSYLIIFGLIMIIGLIITPFLSFLVIDFSGKINLQLTYIIFLVSMAIRHLYAFKLHLMNAYKDNYIATLISSSALIIESIIQIAVIIVTKSFVLFLLAKLIANLIEGIITELKFRKSYKNKLNDNKIIDLDIKAQVLRNTKSLFIMNFGLILITSLDSIFISSFIGINDLANYSNYLAIITGVTIVVSLLFNEITSIIGHQSVKQTKEVFYQNFIKAYTVNFVVGLIFYIGFIAVADDIISILFGPDLVLNNVVVIMISLTYFTQFMTTSLTSFKTASGLFYQDRYRAIIEGVLNVLLTIILVKPFGVMGILFATLFSRLLIHFTVEPYILYKHKFKRSPLVFYFTHFSTVIVFILATVIYMYIPVRELDNSISSFVLKGSVSVIITMLLLFLIYLLYKPFRQSVKSLLDIIKSNIKKKFVKGNQEE